jgi:hypothetical protein
MWFLSNGGARHLLPCEWKHGQHSAQCYVWIPRIDLAGII